MKFMSSLSFTSAWLLSKTIRTQQQGLTGGEPGCAKFNAVWFLCLVLKKTVYGVSNYKTNKSWWSSNIQREKSSRESVISLQALYAKLFEFIVAAINAGIKRTVTKELGTAEDFDTNPKYMFLGC